MHNQSVSSKLLESMRREIDNRRDETKAVHLWPCLCDDCAKPIGAELRAQEAALDVSIPVPFATLDGTCISCGERPESFRTHTCPPSSDDEWLDALVAAVGDDGMHGTPADEKTAAIAAVRARLATGRMLRDGLEQWHREWVAIPDGGDAGEHAIETLNRLRALSRRRGGE